VTCPEIDPEQGGGTVTGGLPNAETGSGGAEGNGGGSETGAGGAGGEGQGTGAGGCTADASHCCLPDGTIVRPGGCQPSYPPNVQAATRRGPDGSCVRIECFLRCLPPTALITTPVGEVAVSELHTGDLVWTVDGSGARVAAPIVRMRVEPVIGSHAVVELTLADGRRVRASGAHPTGEGTTLDTLRPGSAIDGTTVVRTRRVPLEGSATWDLLPAGQTGLYWADGVLLGSTLTPE